MALSEPEVFTRVLDEVSARGYEPLVHVPGGHRDHDDYRPVLERAAEHQITVGGRYPDIVGFDDRDRVFAIEVKGDRGLMKGLGQALHYQQGVHTTYLAADAAALPHIAGVARAHGVGCIGAGPSDIETFEPANPTLERAYLPDVEGQLAYQLRRQASAGAIAGMKLTQPTNFLAPLLAITGDVERRDLTADGYLGISQDRAAILDAMADEYGFEESAGRHAISGATVMDFLVDAGELRVTEYGALVTATLAGVGVTTLADLLEVKRQANRRVLIEEFPILGILLRTSCFRHPEFRRFIEVLSDFAGAGPTEFPTILGRVVRSYPNVFLNMLCTRDGRERARTFIERGETRRLYEDPDVWRRVIRNNVLFNFLSQLKHMGFVASETSTHGTAISAYDPAEKPWIVPDSWSLDTDVSSRVR